MVFEELFMESKGENIIYKGKEIMLADKIILDNKNALIKVTLLSTNSNYREGIAIETKGKMIYEGQKIPPKVVIWEDLPIWENKTEKELIIEIESKDKMLWVYNVWQMEDDGEFKIIWKWHNGAAMYTEEIPEGKIYYCNDGFADDDFDDIIFKIEFLDTNLKLVK